MTLKPSTPPFTERAGAIARALLTDAAIVAGTCAVIAGLDMIARPLALIMGGLALVTLGMIMAVRRA